MHGRRCRTRTTGGFQRQQRANAPDHLELRRGQRHALHAFVLSELIDQREETPALGGIREQRGQRCQRALRLVADNDFLLAEAKRVDDDLVERYAVTGRGVYLNTRNVKRIEFVAP